MIAMTHEEIARYTDALAEVARRTCEAENVFALLSRIQEGGDFSGHHGIADMASLAAKALSALGEKELEDLSKLQTRLMTGA
jgi:hypothetical protein